MKLKALLSVVADGLSEAGHRNLGEVGGQNNTGQNTICVQINRFACDIS